MAASTNPSLLTPLTPFMPECASIPELIDTLPITPPDSARPFGEPKKIDSSAVRKALHVLTNERAALAHLENLYTSSSQAQLYLSSAINHIVQAQSSQGKVVFTGIGKSRLIALKLVATFISLNIHSVFLHPTDALHGDLGMIRPNDVVIMITFSGKTPELLTLLPHIPSYVPMLVMTSHQRPDTCPLLSHECRSCSVNVLLPAPVHQSETSTFGLSAPTTSTTVALALGDSLALSVADKLHCLPGSSPADVFLKNHPGGAIGAAITKEGGTTTLKMSDIAMKVSGVPVLYTKPFRNPRCLDVLLTAVRAPKGWVRTSPTHIVAPRRCQKMTDPSAPLAGLVDEDGPVVIEKTDWISVLGECSVEECRQWIFSMREEGDARGKYFLKRGTILGVVDGANEVSGVVEIEDIVGDDFCWV